MTLYCCVFYDQNVSQDCGPRFTEVPCFASMTSCGDACLINGKKHVRIQALPIHTPPDRTLSIQTIQLLLLILVNGTRSVRIRTLPILPLPLFPCKGGVSGFKDHNFHQYSTEHCCITPRNVDYLGISRLLLPD